MTDLSNVTPANTNEMPTAPQGDTPAPIQEDVPQSESEAPQGEVTEQEGDSTPEGNKPPVELPEPPEKEPESTGNEFIDGLLSEFKEKEVDVAKLLGDYSKTGNINDIDISYLEEKVGKLAAKGLIAGVEAENAKLESKANADAKVIYDAAGGEQMWQGILDWIASGDSGLTREGGEAYNKMLSEGGVQAELAAKELSNMFKQSPGFTQNADLQQADQVAQPVGVEPISRLEYVEELDKAVRQYGEYSPQAEALHKRREFTLRKGAA